MIRAWIFEQPTQIGGKSRLPLGLLGLRLILALYLAQWAWLHWMYSQAAIDVYMRWFDMAPSPGATETVGMVLLLSAVFMAVGAARTASYGVGLVFMLAMVAGLMPHLLNPYGFHQPPNWINHGLIAQVPALAGYFALFILRKSDTISVDAWVPSKRFDLSEQVMPGDKTMGWALLIMRVTCGLFFLQWGIEKFAMTDMSVGMMERWYGVTVSPLLVTYAAGAFQIILACAMIAGVLPRIVYAIGGLIKFKTCLAIAILLLFPFATGSGGRLSTVAASLPVLAVLWFLYGLRAWDTLTLTHRGG